MTKYVYICLKIITMKNNEKYYDIETAGLHGNALITDWSELHPEQSNARLEREGEPPTFETIKVSRDQVQEMLAFEDAPRQRRVAIIGGGGGELTAIHKVMEAFKHFENVTAFHIEPARQTGKTAYLEYLAMRMHETALTGAPLVIDLEMNHDELVKELTRKMEFKPPPLAQITQFETPKRK